MWAIFGSATFTRLTFWGNTGGGLRGGAYISVYGNQSGQHPDVADAYRNIGGVHASLDNHEKALHYYGKAQEGYLAVYGRQHLLVADTLMGTGAVYHKQGRAAEAKESFSRAHQIRLDKLGPDHDKTLDARRHAEMVGEEDAR